MSFYSRKTEVDPRRTRRRERERERARRGNPQERKERTTNAPRMHFQSLYPPQVAYYGSAAMRRYSSRAEEHQKHEGTRIECTRVGVLREIRAITNGLRSDNRDCLRHGAPNTVITLITRASSRARPMNERRDLRNYPCNMSYLVPRRMWSFSVNQQIRITAEQSQSIVNCALPEDDARVEVSKEDRRRLIIPRMLFRSLTKRN